MDPVAPSSHGALRRWASSFLKVGVSAGAVWLIARQVDRAELAEVLAQTDLVAVTAVIALYLLGQALTAYRWKVIAHSVGFAHELAEMLRFYFIGMFFNLFGPSTLGGDVVRGLYLAERDGRRMIALNTVLFDRLSGLAMLIGVAMAALAGFGRFSLPWAVVGLTFAMGIAMALGWFVIPPLVRRFFSPESRVRVLVEEDLGPFWRDRGLLLHSAWVSIGFHVLQVMALILLGQAVGMDVDWRYYFIFHPLVSILSALPISLAGLGIREMGYLWFLELQGIDHATSVAFGLAWFVVLTVSSAVGGLVYVVSGSALPPLRGGGQEAEATSDASGLTPVQAVEEVAERGV